MGTDTDTFKQTRVLSFVILLYSSYLEKDKLSGSLLRKGNKIINGGEA